MTKAPIQLQDLQRKIYVKAKANSSWRFWGLYVHVCKLETLRTAYRLAKANDGAPERPVNRLHRDLVSLGKLGVLRHRRHRLPAPLGDFHDVIGNRLVAHPQPLQMQSFGLDPARDDAAVGQSLRVVRLAHGAV